MSLDDKAFQKDIENKNIIENYCRTYISSKNQSVDEITIHNMVSALSDYLYVTISQDTVNKDFVSRFSTPTGNKCKDGQIEVICNACGSVTSHGSRSFWKHIRTHLRNNHSSFNDMIRKYNQGLIDQYLELSAKGINTSSLNAMNLFPYSTIFKKRERPNDSSSRSSKSSRINRDEVGMLFALFSIDSLPSLENVISPYSNAIVQSMNPSIRPFSEAELQGPILTHLSNLLYQYILTQFKDHLVTMIIEDYNYMNSILIRICLTDGEMTFCWKWISLEIVDYTAEAMSSLIEQEVSSLASNNIQVSGIACSNSELMRNAIGNELLKKQIILHNTPYISFMIEDIFREVFAIPKINEMWNLVKPITDFFCSHRKYMKLLVQYTAHFPPTLLKPDHLSKWKHPSISHCYGDKLNVTTKLGKKIPLRELNTIEKYFNGFVENTMEMIQDHLHPNTSVYPDSSSIFLISETPNAYYTRFFVIKRFIELYDTIATCLDYIRIQVKDDSSLDLQRIHKFSMPKEGVSFLTSLLSFLYPFIQILEFVTNPSSRQNECLELLMNYIEYIKKETFDCITSVEIQNIVLNRMIDFEPTPHTIISILYDNEGKYRIEANKPISKEIDDVLNNARFEAYGVFHGNYDNYENPQTEMEIEHRKLANKIKEELIVFMKNSIDHMGVNIEQYLNHSQYDLLRTIMKKVKGKVTNRIERVFMTWKEDELQLCIFQDNEYQKRLLNMKSNLSILSTDPGNCKAFIHFIQDNPKRRDDGRNECFV